MNATWLPETLALATLTGMRSMSGPAILAHRGGGPLQYAVGALAVGEMLADKTSFTGNRTDPLPLAGRAVIAALIGGVLAHRAHANVVVGGLVATAAAAHLAFHVRRRLPAGALGGVIEDAAVLALATMTPRSARRRGPAVALG